MKKSLILEVIILLFVLLFVYTALSKWFLYSVYLSDLKRSPELGPFAVPISIIIPASELLVSSLLLIGRTRLLGLYGSLVLMALFTLYVTYVLTMTTQRPCTCGGIIRELTWPQHLMFNILFTSLAAIGIWLIRELRQKQNIPDSQTLKIA